MLTRSPLVLAIMACTSIAGCASVAPRASFPQVRQTTEQRLGKQVVWAGNSEEDRAALKHVEELLARPLDPDSAVQIALLSNHNLQATYEELGIAQADLVQAGLLKNPVFSGDLKFFDGGTKIELSVVENFLDVLFIPLKKSLAQAALENAKLRVTLAVMDVASEVRSTFLAEQAAGQILELRQTTLKASEASYDLARRIHAAGNNTPLDLNNERAMYEEAKLNLAAAEAEAVDLHEHLTGLMGLWGHRAVYSSPAAGGSAGGRNSAGGPRTACHRTEPGSETRAKRDARVSEATGDHQAAGRVVRCGHRRDRRAGSRWILGRRTHR